MTAEELASRLALVLIAERRLAEPRSLIWVVDQALAAGAPCVQLRNKGDSGRELLAAAKEIRAATRAAGALFIVNDRLDIALAAGADGVHLGPHDLPVESVRSVVPEGFIIGRSADDPAVAQAAVPAGASYIGCGTVFPTSTKADAGEVIGLDQLRAVVEAVSVPVVGIGGITVDRAEAVRATGAAGVAVVGAVMGAEDPATAVRQLLERA